MIKNERQYRITKAQAARFQQDLAALEAGQSSELEIHPLLLKAQQDALRSQLQDLRAEVEEYETLLSGHTKVLHVDSFDDFPQSLIRARIAAGLSQKELAERLGLKEQQIQRYEATNYNSASLDRVGEVLKALDVSVRKDILLPDVQISPASFFKRLNDLGLPRQFVLQRLLPPALSDQLASSKKSEAKGQQLLRSASIVSHVFNVPVNELFGSKPLNLDVSSMAGIRFKKTAQANEKRLIAYTVYAHHLALLLLEASANLTPQLVPTNPREFRGNVVKRYGDLSFANTLRYIWDLGIPVLPLNDKGGFHGACWRVDRRNVIVLKQQTHSLARWLFDLLHEVRHAGEEPERNELSVIEESSPFSSNPDNPQEEEANDFAGTVALDGRDEELAQQCVQAAKGSVERLKAVVPRVAEAENVPLDLLANYMAYRLSRQKINWWPTANGFQRGVDEEPWRMARDILVERVNWDLLNPADRQLLQQALFEVQ